MYDTDEEEFPRACLDKLKKLRAGTKKEKRETQNWYAPLKDKWTEKRTERQQVARATGKQELLNQLAGT